MGRIFDWHYNEEDYNENAYSAIPEGEYRVRIEQVDEGTSSKGNRMLKITLAVSGYRVKLWKYIVLDNSSREAAKHTNQRLGEFWNSFNIPCGNNMDIDTWIGKSGGVRVRHTIGNDGENRAEVHYFLKRAKVDRLPAWRSPDNTSNTQSISAPVDVPNYPADEADPVNSANTMEGPIPF